MNKSKRVSTKTNVKPRKVYIKDLDKWAGKSIGLVLSRNEALKLVEGLVRAGQNSDTVDLTIFPKQKTPTITITYTSK